MSADGRICLDDAAPLTGRQIVTMALTNAGAPLTIRSVVERLRACRVDPKPVIAEMLTDGSMIPAYVGNRRDLVTYSSKPAPAPRPKAVRKNRMEAREKIYAMLTRREMTSSALAAEAGVSVRQAQKLVTALIMAKLVDKVGEIKKPGVIKSEYIYKARNP